MNNNTKPALSLADMAYSIANEKAIKNDGTPLDITYSEKILREWANSNDPRIQEKFMELVLSKQTNEIQEENKPQGLTAETAWLIRTYFLGIRNDTDDEKTLLAIIEVLEPDLRERFAQVRTKFLSEM